MRKKQLVKLRFFFSFFILLNFIIPFASSDWIYNTFTEKLDYYEPTNTTADVNVNQTDFWDNLNDPSDILTSELNNDAGFLTAEADPLWYANYSLYNDSWSSVHNISYEYWNNATLTRVHNVSYEYWENATLSDLNIIWSNTLDGGNITADSIDGLQLADTITLDAILNILGYNVSINNSDLFVDVTHGRVGVNKTVPNKTLDVDGTGQFSGTIGLNSAIQNDYRGINVEFEDVSHSVYGMYSRLNSTLSYNIYGVYSDVITEGDYSYGYGTFISGLASGQESWITGHEADMEVTGASAEVFGSSNVIRASGSTSRGYGTNNAIYAANDGLIQYVTGTVTRLETHVGDYGYGSQIYSYAPSSGGIQYGYYADLTNANASVTKYPGIFLGGNSGFNTSTPTHTVTVVGTTNSTEFLCGNGDACIDVGNISGWDLNVDWSNSLGGGNLTADSVTGTQIDESTLVGVPVTNETYEYWDNATLTETWNKSYDDYIIANVSNTLDGYDSTYFLPLNDTWEATSGKIIGSLNISNSDQVQLTVQSDTDHSVIDINVISSAKDAAARFKYGGTNYWQWYLDPGDSNNFKIYDFQTSQDVITVKSGGNVNILGNLSLSNFVSFGIIAFYIPANTASEKSVYNISVGTSVFSLHASVGCYGNSVTGEANWQGMISGYGGANYVRYDDILDASDDNDVTMSMSRPASGVVSINAKNADVAQQKLCYGYFVLN